MASDETENTENNNEDNSTEQSSDKPRKSSSQSKKDMLSDATREELSGRGLMSDFVSEGGSRENDSSENSEPDEPEHEADEVVINEEELSPEGSEDSENTGDDENDADSEESDEKEKKRLPFSRKNFRLTPMEEDKLDNIDPNELTTDDLAYEGRSIFGKIVLALVIAGALITGGYFIFIGEEPKKPNIYLSTSEVNENNLSGINVTDLQFEAGKPVYIFFKSPTRLGINKLYIKVTEVASQNAEGAQPADDVVIAQHELSISPDYRKIYTLFQSDYFDSTGSYRIEILKPEGEVLASNNFKIVEKSGVSTAGPEKK